MNMLNLVLIILIPTMVLFLGSIIYISNRHKGFEEEEHMGELILTSPVFKIVKNIIIKSLFSVEIILTLLTMYILSFTVAYVATYGYTTQVLNIDPMYNALFVKRGLLDIDAMDVSNTIIITQIFNPIEVDGEAYYPLLIMCKISDSNISESNTLARTLYKYCRYVQEGYAIIDLSSSIHIENISKALDLGLNVVIDDLSELIDIELIPGVYIVHSLGIIGGLSLRIEHVDKLLLLPLNKNIINRICDHSCETKTIILSFSKEVIKNSDNYKLVSLFDYSVMRTDSSVIMISRSYIPTTRTVLGILLSLLMSMIVVYAVGGGFTEKIIGMGNTLFVIGITKEVFSSMVLLGVSIVVTISMLPIAILSLANYIDSIAFLNFALCAIGFLITTSYRLRRNIGKVVYHEFIPSYSYVVDVHTHPNKLIECIRDYLKEDDFFIIEKTEVIDEKTHFTVRIELIYRRALSTLLFVEIYIDRLNHSVKYSILVDVWSIEDLPSKILTSIHQLALSKILGGVISCIEG